MTRKDENNKKDFNAVPIFVGETKSFHEPKCRASEAALTMGVFKT